jgi:hypothetical protein
MPLSHGPVVIPGVVIVVLLGAGTAINGLTPPPPSSVAPSGIVPPLRVDVMVPGLDSGEAVPFGETAVDDVHPDVEPVDPIALPDPVVLSPAPSNVVLVPVADDVLIVDDVPIVDEVPAIPASPEEADVVAAQPVSGAGLKPPGKISVAPSGTPVRLFPVGA